VWSLWAGFGRPIGPHGVWGNIDTEFHRQFCCDARLPPSRILPCHTDDELADVFRQARPANPRFPLPEQFETVAVPADERLRLDDHQGTPPIEQLRPEHEGETSGVV
jgi:hypothetical protein